MQIGEQRPHQVTQVILGVLQDLRQALAKLGQALADDNPVLAQQAAQPIGLGGALLHQTTAHPVQGQDILLLGGLHRHEAHTGTADGFANRLSIVGVVLVPLHVGLDELRADELDLIPELPETPAPSNAPRRRPPSR